MSSHFDEFSKILATATSRRTMLRQVAGLLSGIVVMGLGAPKKAQAQTGNRLCCPTNRICRVSPTAAPFCCPANTICVNGQCVCAPGTTVCTNPLTGGLVCCPEGSVCINGACCPRPRVWPPK